ncbi:MAG: septum site-determining protein MinC [Clostridia bacterium]|nr:septum site-determining protein MinC [Clostridia bacterium]
MKNALVTVKGDREGLHIFCEETSSWSKVIAEIKERLSGENKIFFAGASVIIELGNRDLSVKDVSLLWKTFEQCGIKIKGIRTDSSAETSIETKEKDSEQEDRIKPVHEQETSATEFISPKPVYILNRNMRSGQNITFDGNVIVFGDVNPGAEIIATGFIMVMGTLRGIAHAGSSGDERAWVMAYRLQPSLLRIANCIARAPEDEPLGPEIAKINENVIICEPFKNIEKY